MKKVFISILTLCALAASAQEEETTETTLEKSSGGSITDVLLENSNKDLSFVTKNGHEVLPQKGDWGIGISATNLLDFAQGAFSNGNGTATFGSINGTPAVTNNGGTTISGKFFKSSHTAYRGFLTTQTSNISTLSQVVDDGNPTEGVLLNDQRSFRQRGIIVGLGLEKRRGNGRLIGMYGVEGYLGFGQGNITKYNYANEYSATNDAPSDAFGQTGTAVGGVAGDQRVLETRNASDVMVGARAFLGVEYFIAPKLSLGGEFNLGVQYNPNTSSYETVEYFDTETKEAAEFTRETKQGSSLTSGTQVLSGNLSLNFYF